MISNLIVLFMGKSKKPSRREDMKKAESYLDRYREHQVKLHENPGSFTTEHWKQEKQNFKTRMAFHMARAGANQQFIVICTNLDIPLGISLVQALRNDINVFKNSMTYPGL
ncbi:MAG TPA: hypothetical protein VKM55_03820 [Candidatus Lokiarchaeia archaeon]|nr:hypothetical protein [Candidatus Lokiarchaeia archaeon]